MDSAVSLTDQLRTYSSASRESANALVQEILPRLKKIAASKLSREHLGTLVTPTDLVGEVWASSLHRGHWEIENREHFFCIVGLAMQNVLTDMARRRLAQRRGKGATHISLDMISSREQPAVANAEQVIAISMLLEKLAKVDERAASVVRLHYLIGLSLEDIGGETGLTLRQVRYRWERGKTWLAVRLNTGLAKLKDPSLDRE